jgi:hypothetical protein
MEKNLSEVPIGGGFSENIILSLRNISKTFDDDLILN